MASHIETQHVWVLVSHKHRLLPLTSQCVLQRVCVYLRGNLGMVLCVNVTISLCEVFRWENPPLSWSWASHSCTFWNRFAIVHMPTRPHLLTQPCVLSQLHEDAHGQVVCEILAMYLVYPFRAQYSLKTSWMSIFLPPSLKIFDRHECQELSVSTEFSRQIRLKINIECLHLLWL